MFKSFIVSALLMFACSLQADVTYSFFKVTNNNVEDLGGQLSVNVTDAGSGQTSFVFTNNVGIASSIVQLYFDNGAGSYITDIGFGTQVGVSYGDFSANPGNLPGGNLISFNADFSAEPNSQGGKSNNGVNADGDSIEIIADAMFASVIAGMNAGDLRLGLHVQAIGQAGGSDGYVTAGQISAVPVPAALPLMASALGLFGIARRRK